MTIWLTNPARGQSNPGTKRRANKGGKMSKRKTPPRYKSGPKKGQFMPKAARRRKRSNPTRKRRRSTSSRSSAPRRRRRRTTRRNPPVGDLLGRVTGGFVDAITLTAAQGITRLVPGMLKLPQAGPVGLAISTAVAIALGMASEYVLGADAARLASAAALSVPLQQAALQYVAPKVPVVGSALVPTLGAYPRRRLPAARGRMGAYPAGGAGGFDFARGYTGLTGYDYATAAAYA